MLSDLLPAMVASARRSAEMRQQALAPGELERQLAAARPAGEGFRASLMAPGLRVIAECKRRSPSKGILRDVYDPAVIARGYEAAGAAAISVLTEASFFDGSLDHLRAVRAAVKTPVLRKDFISTSFQVVEARAAGADALLLIVAALDDVTLRRLLEEARALGLAALVEVHDEEELTRAVQAGAEIIGVNSRNLRTLEVNPSILENLIAFMPAGVVPVAESGLRSIEDLRRLSALGYNGFLIGERFMTEANPGAALAELIGARTDVEESHR